VRSRARLRHATAVIGGEKVFSVSAGEPVAGVPVVVCVHGLGVGGRYFAPLMRRLAPHTRVLAPDLPGFGRSANPRRVYDVSQLAAVLDEWLELQALERPPVLVANSMGCQVAAALLDGRPGRASGLLLVGPTMDANNRTALSQVSRLLRVLPFERVALVPLVACEYMRCGPRRLLGSLRHALRDPLEAHLPQIAVPAIVARGQRDAIAPADWAAQVATLLPCGERVTVPRTGHALNFSAPDRLVPHVLRLLTATP
jgi:pimeloyl-ACP methyl ester carboxylesterase